MHLSPAQKEAPRCIIQCKTLSSPILDLFIMPSHVAGLEHSNVTIAIAVNCSPGLISLESSTYTNRVCAGPIEWPS